MVPTCQETVQITRPWDGVLQGEGGHCSQRNRRHVEQGEGHCLSDLATQVTPLGERKLGSLSHSLRLGCSCLFLSDDSVVKCTIAKIGAKCTLLILWAPVPGKSCSSSWCSHCFKKTSSYNWTQAGKWYLSCWTSVEGFYCVKEACL